MNDDDRIIKNLLVYANVFLYNMCSCKINVRDNIIIMIRRHFIYLLYKGKFFYTSLICRGLLKVFIYLFSTFDISNKVSFFYQSVNVNTMITLKNLFLALESRVFLVKLPEQSKILK